MVNYALITLLIVLRYGPDVRRGNMCRSFCTVYVSAMAVLLQINVIAKSLWGKGKDLCSMKDVRGLTQAVTAPTHTPF